MIKKRNPKPVEVTVVCSGEEELESILMRAFDLYITCEVARRQADAV